MGTRLQAAPELDLLIGGTRDLTLRKLLPARLRAIGVAREDLGTRAYRALARKLDHACLDALVRDGYAHLSHVPQAKLM